MSILKINGKIFIALRQGESEGYEKYHNKEGSDRWFSYYDKEEFDLLIPRNVKIIRYNQIAFKNRNFLNYHLQK